MPEIRRHRSNIPVILCGCQNDLRIDPEIVSNLARRGRSPVNPEQALAVCCDVGAVNYVETSALTSEVIEAFEVSALAFMKSFNFMTHCSQNSAKFNTTSSKNSSNKLNISCETAEFSASQIAQPQQDFFPSPQLSRKSQRASFSATSESSPHGGSATKTAKNLMRKASFRSPAGPSSNPNGGGKKAAAYESLKSQGSTGSTGSKNSNSSSVLLDLDENVPDTEDPELLNQLSFVSPKAGVYRPVNNPIPSGKIKDKDKCILMWINQSCFFLDCFVLKVVSFIILYSLSARHMN